MKSVAAAPSFNPLTDLDLALWLDASQLTGLSDNDAVASWTDLSANTNHAIQAVSGKRPTYKTGILNGLPVVRFDPADDCLVTTSTVDLSGTDDITVWAVFSAPSGTDRIVVEMSQNYFVQTDSFLLYRTAADKIELSTKDTFASNVLSTPTVTTTHAVAVGTIDRGLATNESSISVNGDSTFTRPLNGNSAGNFGNRLVYICARNQTAVFFGGDLAELGIATSAVTGDDLAALETYLMDKWGIA